MTTIGVSAYVDWDGDLVTMDTAERIRKATPSERRESRQNKPTGAIDAFVARRTLAMQCPKWVKQMVAYKGWW